MGNAPSYPPSSVLRLHLPAPTSCAIGYRRSTSFAAVGATGRLRTWALMRRLGRPCLGSLALALARASLSPLPARPERTSAQLAISGAYATMLGRCCSQIPLGRVAHSTVNLMTISRDICRISEFQEFLEPNAQREGKQRIRQTRSLSCSFQKHRPVTASCSRRVRAY